MAIPRLIKCGEAGSEFVPFAKKKFREFEQRRKRLGLPCLKKTIAVAGLSQTIIEVLSSNWDNYIYIYGIRKPEIYLVGYDGYAIYSYTDDTINVKTHESEHPQTTPLFDLLLFSGDSVVDITASNEIFTQIDSSILNNVVATDTHRGISYYLSGGALSAYCRNFGLIHLGAITGVTTLDDTIKQASEIIAFAATPLTGDTWWNGMSKSVHTLGYNGMTGQSWQISPWDSAIFYMYHGGSLYWDAGFFYGNPLDGSMVYGPEPGEDEGASSIEAKFEGYVDIRNPDALLIHSGHVESLIRIGDVNVWHTFVYFRQDSNVVPQAVNATYYDCNSGGVNAGTSKEPQTASIAINYGEIFTQGYPLIEPLIHVWTAGEYIRSLDLTVTIKDIAGIVCVVGSRIVVHRVVSALTTQAIGSVSQIVIDSSRYIKHSVSTDGTILAVFEGEDGFIDSVTVVDLVYSSRFTQEEIDAVAGTVDEIPAWKVIQKSELVSDAAANDAAIIPMAADDVEWHVPTESMPQSIEFDGLQDERFYPAYGGIRTNSVNCQWIDPTPDVIWKLLATGEKTISGVLTENYCNESGVTIIRPSDSDVECSITIDGETYSGYWATLSTQLPYTISSANGISRWAKIAILGKFEVTGTGNNSRVVVHPVGATGSNVTIDEGGGLPELEIYYSDINHDYRTRNAVGDRSLSYSGDGYIVCDDGDGADCATAESVVLVKQTETCQKFYGGVFTAETSCGQTATLSIPPDDDDPFHIEFVDGTETTSARVYCYGGESPYRAEDESGNEYEPDGNNYFDLSACREYTFFDNCGHSAGPVEVEPWEMRVVGPEDCAVGESYSAAGGCPPFTYSISCGEISESGMVTDISGCCGTGTVTVSSADGQTATKTVRFPDGQWVLQSSASTGDYLGLSSHCEDGSESGCGVNPYNPTLRITIISGAAKTDYFEVGLGTSVSNPISTDILTGYTSYTSSGTTPSELLCCLNYHQSRPDPWGVSLGCTSYSTYTWECP